MTIELREYQNEARYKINALLNAGRHPLYVAATGTGKTITAAAIIQDRMKLNRKVFVLCPQEEIFVQWMKVLSMVGLRPGYINSEGFRGRGRSVYVCMPLSLVNMLDRLPESAAPDEIITDEAHHSQADTWKCIYNFYGKALRIGLTATPLRTDNKPLGDLYTDIVETITMKEAIEKKYLAKPLIIVPERYKLKIPIQNGEFNPYEQAKQLGKAKIIGDMVEQYSIIFAGLPILIACSTYEHAKMINEEFKKAGWNFDHIHSLLASSDRRRMIRDIKSGKLNGLCTVGIGIEGMDIPGLYGLIWMRRTMSLTIYLQFIGRILRTMPGKEYGIIVDSVGNAFIHGHPALKRKWSLETDYKADINEDEIPSMKICPVCSVMNASENINCHICEFDFTDEEAFREINKRKIPSVIDGKLVVLAGNDQKEYIKQKIEEQKKENEKHEEQKKAAETLEVSEKIDIISTGLTGRNIKSSFKNTLRNFV